MSNRGKHWLQIGFAALAWCAVAFLVSCFWIASNGCQGRYRPTGGQTTPSDLPSALRATGEAADQVREATNEIQNAAAKIEVTAPEAGTQVQAILVGVSQLRHAWDLMMATKATIAAEVKASTRLSKDLAAANKRIAELERKENGLLTKLLAGAAAAGLLLAVVSLVWLKSGTGALVGISIFVACVIGQWIIAYRIWIAIVAAIVAAGYTAWCLIIERKAASQVVATVEAIKRDVPEFKTIANRIQTSAITRTLVDRIKASLPRNGAK